MTTDTKPKTLAGQMADAIEQSLRASMDLDFGEQVLPDYVSIPDAAEAAARVMLERMLEYKTVGYRPADFITAFAREHGLSAEDERE